MSASASRKAQAASFLHTRRADISGDLLQDVKEGLKFARSLPGKNKSLIYVGDGLLGRRDVEGPLAEIRAMNTEKVAINTIGVNPYQHAEAFLKMLAAENGGTYRRIGTVQ